MFSSKKAVSELVSFILITLVVTIVASVAYFFSDGLLDRNIVKLDEDRMESILRKVAYESSQVTTFDGASTSLTVTFSSGLLEFSGNQIRYLSLAKADSEQTSCFTICYSSEGGSSRLYYNLTDGYTFNKNLTLSPGEYIVILENDKSQSKINLAFR